MYVFIHLHFSVERAQRFHQILKGMHYLEKVKDHNTI